ncbi:MAG: 3-hydroxyacyl-CoA dehydrogenase NAD-binding domain-containing protein [candidate division Zixibacteria bacterium]|nr:3-hydroxyacyl-CoA dehydrogenase NAD-binding domain-containing protein [candidate division Zixibacteria bacterium]
MPVHKVVVVGAGVMGRGISELIASTGCEVVLVDKSEEILKNSLHILSESMDNEIEKWGLTKSEKKAIISRIKPTTSLEETCDVKIVIEAVPENLESKQEVFKQLDLSCSPETIIITNTSTLSITELASSTKRPDKVIGMHFLFPVTKVPLVEIVRGLKTSQQTYGAIKDFADQLNKTPVTVYEYPGYVTTRIIVPFLNEAMHVLMEGIASADDIDTAMKLGFGFNIGPLALADMMGLDVVMSWMENLLNELSEHKYNPCPLLRKMVRAGHLGQKTGQGFFMYDAEGNRIKE